MGEMMNQMNAQMEVLPPWVQYWMNWMMLVFLSSLGFVWTRKAARYVLLSLFLTMPVGMVVFYFTQTVHLLGIAHILVWGPLFYCLARFEIKAETFSFKSAYGVWLGLLLATILVSLIFDVRDSALVILGHK